MVGAWKRSIRQERDRLRRGSAAPASSETCFPVGEGWLSLSSRDREALWGSGLAHQFQHQASGR
jgi:hypothetical protein